MTRNSVALIAALSGLLLASCGSRPPAVAENEATQIGPDAPGSASPSQPDHGNRADPAGVQSIPPPDAVSHPEGYLPDPDGPPPPSAREPATDSPPASKEPPPATEDEFIRNRQSG
jgi:hypothetical protein